jgi:hypothetical protein
MRAATTTLLACAALVLLPAPLPAQQVYKEISSDQLEGLLKDLNLNYTKGDAGKGTTYYDYKSNNMMLRLWNFNGKDLMIDIFLPKVDWEVVNKWNGTAKFSRARLNKDPKSGLESTVIESNLDLVGGVTDDTVKHFIKSFDLEVKQWANTAIPAVTEEVVVKKVTPKMLEKVLDELKIQYKKGEGKAKDTFFYDFKRNNFDVRLTCFGGDDLMIDCIWGAAPVAKLNQWNLKRHYIRAVLYGGTTPYVALESNLDCIGGTSESIIRYFITTFDVEVRDFDAHLKAK